MGRDIKFRAWGKPPQSWDKREGVMVDDFYIKSDGTYINTVFAEDAVLMQYTGLKDESGQEMWESDIVSNDSGRICAIEWFKSAVYCGWDLKALNDIGEPNKEYNLWVGWTVIGNIHQNPELLK